MNDLKNIDIFRYLRRIDPADRALLFAFLFFMSAVAGLAIMIDVVFYGGGW